MSLFLIVSPLIAAALLWMLLRGRVVSAAGTAPQVDVAGDLIAPAAIGAVVAIPMYALVLAADTIVSLEYAPGSLYIYFGLRDLVGWFGVAALFAALTQRAVRKSAPYRLYDAYLAYFAANLTLRAIADAVLIGSVSTSWEVLLQPLVRIALLAVYPLAMVVADTREGGGWAVLFLLLVPAMAALVPMWYEWLRPGAAVGAALATCAFAAATTWWLAGQPGRAPRT